MKVLNFGSLNYDYIYELDHFVKAKETLASKAYRRDFGGKGLNQSIALNKAGINVYHAGRVGYDGDDFLDYLLGYHVNSTYIYEDDSTSTGHAIIEIANGENRIILYGGANQLIDEKQIDETLEYFGVGDVLLIQNEISSLAYLIKKAHDKGLYIVFNVAPMNENIFTYPLELINMFVVNEIEAKGLANIDDDNIDEIIKALKNKYYDKEIIITVGEDGSYYLHKDKLYYQEAIKTLVIDTTAAGDTFIGYFLASYLTNKDAKEALLLASKASSITVSKKGSSNSIPTLEEINE